MANMTVRDLLETIPKDETIYYRSNPGNAGDALIAAGTFHLLDNLQLNFEFINPTKFDATNKIVIYAGGGNFNHIYPDAADFISKHHRFAKKLILLPHTITGNEELLSRLGNNCILFSREEISADHINKFAVNCINYIDHDMAFHLDIEKIKPLNKLSTLSLVVRKIGMQLINSEKRHQIPTLKRLLKLIRFELVGFGKNYYVNGNFFRVDVEASGFPVPKGNFDLSRMYEFGTQNREIIELTVSKLLTHIDKFSKINTDRLHICIAAGFLGKDVYFFGNSYFKCRAVFEHSISSRFKNVTWTTR